MTITIDFGAYTLQNNETLTQRVQFIYSPLNELFRSLHVLLNPRHHGMNIEWALEAKQKLPNEFFNDLHYFSLFYELGVPSILFDNFENLASDLDTEIQQLKVYLASVDSKIIGASLQKVANDRENQYIPELAKGLEWQGFNLAQSGNLLKDLAQAPAQVYQHLFAFLTVYRQQVFDQTWQEKGLATFLRNEIRQQSEYLRQNGFVGLINHLQVDRMHWQQNQLVVTKPFTEKIQLSDQDAILLIPSYFIWPHLFVNQFKYGVVINYDALDKLKARISPDKLAVIFKALSDTVRLKMMKYLADQPYTTQALGQILTMSDSTVSHHLKLLKEAQLVMTVKKGKFVLYEPTSLINELMPGFYTYLTSET
ncbi:transcriptional regulator, ArsR family [Agrilactobacillus composti DSM 18527 = JCM 14202]|uniref:Transcriptional regulator, ArsR family n=1 Tax=Agrilactobacillus composti DSM 18527 = JCM 14202 TaxID=1423734 RepID=X0PFA5_9LACO|nr:DUF5937 family protein [Agrilactobacillus composti]KRM31425.1 transcriptional regulator, ArsR family [Agrilactobacillus composti DSM 18527 = JCM 14202]GAF40373.1 transcriptional regulator, ArsR family [Agrilactobacillus composti DSM 18527 = JCM 14202]